MDQNRSRIPWGQYQNVVWVTLLLFAVGGLYGQFLWNPIVFDDLALFMVDAKGQQPVSDYEWGWLAVRSLPYATLAWTKAWFGLELIYFRLGNLMIHGLVAVVIFGFLREFYAAVLGEQTKKGMSWAAWAFFAAMLFAVHPVATYAAAYLVQRTILMATLFCVLAMWSYTHGSMRKSRGWLWMSVPLYYLAVFSKEHAIMLPAVLIGLTVLLHEPWKSVLKQRLGMFLALAGIALLVLATKKGLLGAVYEVNAGEMLGQEQNLLAYPLSVLTQAGLFFKYVGLWLLPNPAWMSVDMREAFAPSLWSMHLVGALGYLLWGAIGLWLLFKRGRLGLVGLALLFPWLMFWTEFSAVRIQEAFVLYRSYLWAVGGLLVLPLAFDKLDAKVSAAVLSVIAVVMFAISMERLTTMSHPILLWSDAEMLVHERPELPGAARIYYNLGTELIKTDLTDQAIENLKKATELEKNFPQAHGNLGIAYFKKGEWQQAATSLSVAIELMQNKGQVPLVRYTYARAQAWEHLGEASRAQMDYRESCRLIQRGCEKLKP